mgnify:CR=1 FL=1
MLARIQAMWRLLTRTSGFIDLTIRVNDTAGGVDTEADLLRWHRENRIPVDELIAGIFARHLSDPAAEGTLDVTLDAAPIALGEGEPYMTTDGFIVQPIEFPGGDIGSLAVNGTVNDLAVSGASPLYLSLNAFIEEGLEIATLDRIVASLAEAARAAGVRVVAGDTKVLPRGEGGGLYLATTGVGLRPVGLDLGLHRIRPGDSILVSGPIGDHGIAVLGARGELGFESNIESDVAPLNHLVAAMLEASDQIHVLRDPTRGGLATVCSELARATGRGISLEQSSVPVRDAVISVCEMLGYDPLYLACEGRVVAIVDPAQADRVLECWRALPAGRDAAIVGEVADGRQRVVLVTELGGERILEELEDDPLPRIC